MDFQVKRDKANRNRPRAIFDYEESLFLHLRVVDDILHFIRRGMYQKPYISGVSDMWPTISIYLMWSTMSTYLAPLVRLLLHGCEYALHERDMLGAIANENRPLSAYDFHREKTLKKYRKWPQSYSTIHAKLSSLRERGYLEAKQQAVKGRIVIKHSLTLKGLLASLASPLLTDQMARATIRAIASHLNIPERHSKGAELILYLWLRGLKYSRVDLERTPLQIDSDFFNRTFSDILSRASKRPSYGSIDITSLLPEFATDNEHVDELRDVESFASDFIEWNESQIIGEDLNRGPFGLGSYPISIIGRIVLRLAVHNLQDALAEVSRLCADGVLSPDKIPEALKSRVDFTFLPTYLCTFQKLDKRCKGLSSEDFCVGAQNGDLVWRCRAFRTRSLT